MRLYNPREKTIEISEKTFRFKNIPVEELQEKSKDLEGLLEELAEKTEAPEKLADEIRGETLEIEEMLTQRERLLTQYDNLMRIDNLPLDEIKEARKLLEESDKLKKQSDKKIKQVEKKQEEFKVMNEELSGYFEGMEQKLNGEYCKICCEILEGFTEEDYKKRSSNDELILKNIIEFKDKIMTNTPENKLQQRVRELVEAKYDNKSFQA
jgi:hypothetical protein